MLLSRRDFLRSGAMAAAAIATKIDRANARQAATTSATQPAARTLGWALVGLGGLARGQLVPALKKTRLSRLSAVVTGHAEKLDAIDAPVKPKSYTYETLDALRDDPAVDVVYIVLPNGMHAEYTIRAAKAGKHVFCEKPMANSVADCQRMIDACRAANRQLAIAYRMVHEPNLREARRLVRDGAIGKVRSIESQFGFNIGPMNWRLSKKMAGGGPLMDIGIYSINAARFVLGEEPIAVSATIPDKGKDDPRFVEVEHAMDYSLTFPGGVEARCKTAYNATLGTMFRIDGERGTILMFPAFMYFGNRITLERDGKVEVLTKPNVNQFATEIDAFSQSILNGTASETPGEEGLRDMVVIEALYRSAAEKRAIELR
jgi:glucose-fructose oxidoreductase